MTSRAHTRATEVWIEHKSWEKTLFENEDEDDDEYDYGTVDVPTPPD